MTRPLALCLPLALLLAAACDQRSDCVATVVTVEDATKVDVRSPGRSGTVSARLLDRDGAAIPGKPLHFEVEADGAAMHSAEARTASDGWARVDLKRADPATLVALVRADRIAVSFAGDTRYCSAADEAPFRAVNR